MPTEFDLTYPATESRKPKITITDSDSNPVDLTGSILKFFVYKHYKKNETRFYIEKKSYNSSEIQFSDPVNGEAIVVLRSEDLDQKPGNYRWRVELSRRDSLSTSTGTIDLTAGSFIIDGTGLDLASIYEGDILVPQGVQPNNTTNVTIESKELDSLGNETGNLIVDYNGWSDEAGVSFEIYSVNKKMPEGLCGDFVITECK